MPSTRPLEPGSPPQRYAAAAAAQAAAAAPGGAGFAPPTPVARSGDPYPMVPQRRHHRYCNRRSALEATRPQTALLGCALHMLVACQIAAECHLTLY